MRTHVFALALIFLLGGCSADLRVSGEVDVACGADGTCPEGFVCRASIQRCVPRSELSGEGPTVVAASSSVQPDVAAAGSTVRVVFSTNVALAALPALSLRDVTGAAAPITGPFVLERKRGREYAFLYVPSGAEAPIQWTVAVTLVDDLGNVSENLTIGSVRFDFAPPGLGAGVSATPAVVQAGTETRISVSASEIVAVGPDQEPRLLLTWADGTQVQALEDVSARDVSGRSFVFRYTPRGDEPQEPAGVSVTWSDLAGNRGSTQAPGVVRFDFTPPSLAALGPDILPPAGSLLPSVRAATVGSTVQVVVGASEPLGELPILWLEDLGGAVLASSLGEQSDDPGEYVMALELTAALGLVDGTYQVFVTARDALPGQAGNERRHPVGTFSFDGTRPVSPDVTPTNAMIYRRTPWGSQDTPDKLPRFTLEAAPGVLVDDGYSWLVALDRKTVGAAQEIGRGRVLADGSVAPFTVVAADLARPFVVVADAAGNLSDAEPDVGIQGTRVVHTIWTASLNGKLPGSLVENPHEVAVTEVMRDTLVQAEGTVAEPASMVFLEAALDGSTRAVLGRRVWSRRGTSLVRPAPRNQHAAAYDAARARLVLFGGFEVDGSSSETWELEDSQWVRKALFSAPPGRHGHAMVYDAARGEVLLFGGKNGGTLFADTWVWDGEAWNELQPPDSPPPRELHRMTYDARRQVVVLFGGHAGLDELDDLWEWNGEYWIERPALGIWPEARDSHAMAYDAAREVTVMYGGLTTQAGVFLNGAIWEWNGAAWRALELVGPRPAPQRSAMAYDPRRQRVVLFGQETWERADAQWIAVSPSPAPEAREYPALAYSAAHRGVLMFGGGLGNYCAAPPAPSSCRNDLWAWSGEQWTPLMDAVQGEPAPRDRLSMVYAPNLGMSVMFAGSSGGTFFGDLWGWSGTGWVPLVPGGPPTPSERFRSTLAFDRQRARLLAFGGIDPQPATCSPNNTLNDCGDYWTWDAGAGWIDMTSASAPPPARSAAAVAYDPDRERLVLYGGSGCVTAPALPPAPPGCYAADGNSGTCSDTWEWDATTGTWAQAPSTSNPPALSRHAMTYDEARQRVVLFGGEYDVDPLLPPCTSDGVIDETWEWGVHGLAECGSAVAPCWKAMTVAGEVPPARSGHALAYDAERRRAVLFGGQEDSVSVRFDDTWEWNGTAWRELPVAYSRPAKRFGHGLTYDAARKKLVLFGGVGESDTWELDADPEQRPAVLFAFDLGYLQADVTAVAAIEIVANASGIGYANAASGDGVAQAGVTLLAWSAASGVWESLASSTNGQVSFASSSTAQARRLVTADRRLHLALRPTAGLGNGVLPPRVDVDYIEVTVHLHQ